MILPKTTRTETQNSIWGKGMRKQVAFAAIIGLLFIEVASVYSAGQLGVRIGDWVRFDVTVTGNTSRPSTPTWVRVEFLNVLETIVTVRWTTHLAGGIERNQTLTYDLTTGNTTGETNTLLGIVIPLHSKVGDTIDIVGTTTVTISGEDTRAYAGASRVVLYASFSAYGAQLTYYWDKQTGVVVEEILTSTNTTAKVVATNMWQAQFLGLPIDPTTFYILMAVVIVIVAAITIYAIRRRKKRPPEREGDFDRRN